MNKEELIYNQEVNQKVLDYLLPYIRRINQYQLRAKKYELILNPIFDLIVFRDKKTKHQYLQAKVYWPDKNGDVRRILSFSLGNLNNYPNGRNDIEIAKEKVSNILMKKFGTLM